MTQMEKIIAWEAIFVLGKGLTYVLAMACMIKYLIA